MHGELKVKFSVLDTFTLTTKSKVCDHGIVTNIHRRRRLCVIVQESPDPSVPCDEMTGLIRSHFKTLTLNLSDNMPYADS